MSVVVYPAIYCSYNSTIHFEWIILSGIVLALVFVLRCESVVEKFLSLDLDDPSTDLQSFLKDELLPSIGEVL